LYCGRIKAPESSTLQGVLAEDEDIKTHIIDLQDAFHLLESGKLSNAAAIIAIMWLKENKAKLQDLWNN